MKYEAYQDEELIRMLRKGDQGITDYMIEKYKGLVLKKARAMYLIGGETDDLIQEGMIGLFKAVRDYQEEKNAAFFTFANLCIDRQLYSAIQSSNRKKHHPLNTYISLNNEEWESELRAIYEQNPESIIIDREDAKCTEKKIYEKLSPFENIVLSLYLQGNDYTQIGEILEKKPKSIDNALQRIRVKVKEHMRFPTPD